jgi:hypothetical protein
MSKQAFAKLIISKLAGSIGVDGSKYSSSTQTTANQAIAQACQEYIIANTKISVSYKGIIPGTPPTPDPVVADMELVKGKVSPPKGNDFNTWIKSLESNIISGMYLSPGPALVTPIAPTLAFKKGLSIDRSELYAATGDSNKNAQEVAWEKVCEKILLWLNSSPNAGTTYPASRVASKGVATIIKTIIA